MDTVFKVLSIILGISVLFGLFPTGFDMDEIANKAFDFVNEAEARQGALKKTAPRPSEKPAKDKVEAYWEGVALPVSTEQLIRQHFDKIEALKIPKGYRTAEIELWFPDGIKRVPYLSFIAELVAKDMLKIEVDTLLARAEVHIINRMDGSELIAVFTRNGNTITPVEMVHTDDYSEIKGVILNGYIYSLIEPSLGQPQQ